MLRHSFPYFYAEILRQVFHYISHGNCFCPANETADSVFLGILNGWGTVLGKSIGMETPGYRYLFGWRAVCLDE